MPFYTRAELKSLSFASLGNNVQISRLSSLYNCQNIHIGNNVRIDDFCVLSASKKGIYISDYVHIAVFCSLIGAGKIQLGKFCNLSSRVSIYSSNDDYSGEFMTNPMIPKELTNVQHADVIFDKHVIIGSGSVILPDVHLEEGVAVASMSLIKRNCKAFYIYAGSPARKIKKRKSNLLKLEQKLLSQIDNV